MRGGVSGVADGNVLSLLTLAVLGAAFASTSRAFLADSIDGGGTACDGIATLGGVAKIDRSGDTFGVGSGDVA